MVGVLFVAAEESQQEDKEVDEVEIQIQRAQHGGFALELRIVAEPDFEEVLGVVCREEGKDDYAGAADEEIKHAIAPEYVDNQAHEQPDEQHQERATQGAQIPLGHSAVYGHGAEHGGGAAKGFAHGFKPVADEDRPEE